MAAGSSFQGMARLKGSCIAMAIQEPVHMTICVVTKRAEAQPRPQLQHTFGGHPAMMEGAHS